MDNHTINVLFICSMNQWRSPTAENVYQKNANVNPRSRGTSRQAVRTVSSADLKWADLILVMEPKHANRLRSDFPGDMRYANLHVLDIPDDYKYMDPDLITEIISAVDPLIAEASS